MKQFIIDLDFLTTKEFCKKYELKLPSNSNKKTKEELSFEFITLNTIEYKMIVAGTKKKMTVDELNELSNSSILAHRKLAVKELNTKPKMQSKLGECEDCIFVSKDKRSCNHQDYDKCNIFTNSLFEYIIEEDECTICGNPLTHIEKSIGSTCNACFSDTN